MKKIFKFLFNLSLIFLISLFFLYIGTNIKSKEISNPEHLNSLDKYLLQISRVPLYVKNFLMKGHFLTGEYNEFIVNRNFKDNLDFIYNESSFEDLGHAIISTYSEKKKAHEVYLINLNNGKKIHNWDADIDSINRLSKINRNLVNLEKNLNDKRYPYYEPKILKDGGIIFQGASPLIKIDKCSNFEWQIDELFHHSIEFVDENTVWTSIRKVPGKFKEIHENYHDDIIAKINLENQKILFQKSITEILVENNLGNLLDYSYIAYDPIHVNDVQPVLKDTDYFKKGDLFLSLRTISTILLYRPSTNEVLWHKTSPMIMQHDINILNDHSITLFNNNNLIHDKNNSLVPLSEIIVFDFKINQFLRPYRKIFEDLNIRTLVGSKGKIIKNIMYVWDFDNNQIIFYDLIKNKKILTIKGKFIIWGLEYYDASKKLKEINLKC